MRILAIGIYKITNLINNKIYIGQSTNIKKRWNDHKSSAFNDNSKVYDYPLYRAIRKYGLDNFSFEIIEECLIEELNEKECSWINLTKSFYKDFGYNMSLGGGNFNNPIKLTLDLVDEIILKLKNTSESQQQIAEEYEVTQSTISLINTGAIWLKNNIDYPIRSYENITNYCIDCGEIILKGSIRCTSCRGKTLRKVERPNRKELKNLIRNNSFVEIAKRFSVSDNAIRKWCVTVNLPKTKKEINSYSNEEWDLI